MNLSKFSQGEREQETGEGFTRNLSNIAIARFQNTIVFRLPSFRKCRYQPTLSLPLSSSS